MSAFVTPSGAPAIVSEAREILGPGTEVEGIGRIGAAFFDVVGISRDDRVVFQAQTSTGAEGVFSVDESGIETLRLVSEPNGLPVRLGRVRTNANRVVFAEGFATPNVFLEVYGFYQIAPGATPPLVELLDIVPDDQEVCALWDFVLNDRGSVALTVSTAPLEALCRFDWSESHYIFEDGSFRNVLRISNTGAPNYQLLGLTDDASLLVSRSDYSGILTIRDGQLVPLVSAGDTSPSGGSFPSVFAAAANSLGEVAFYSSPSGSTTLFRTQDGSVVRVAGTGDLIAGEYELESFPGSSTLLNDAGVLAVGVQLRHRASGATSQSAVLFPPSGAPRLLALSGSPGGINDRGTVAIYDGERDAILLAESEDEPKQLVRFGDAVREGEIFATGGLYPEGRCLAADGRVGATVVSHVASRALACGDAEGFVALTGPNNPARDGSPFAAVGDCAFAETAVLFAGAHDVDGLREWNLYRADAAGLERLVGPDQVTADGARVIELNDDLGDQPSFQANAPGSVLVRADTDRGERLLRRRADGALESIDLNMNPDLPIQRVIATRLMDDDTVLGTVQLATDENAIVTSDGTSVRLLVTASDPRLPDGPFDFLGVLSVGGDRIVIRASTNDDFVETLLYSDALGFLPFFADGIERETRQATVGGRALVEDVVDGQTRQFLLAPDGSLTLLATRGLGGRTVIAINDRDNVLFRANATLLQTSRDALLLSGPVPSARCPRAPATETPEPTVTSSPTETPRPTETATSVETSTPTRTPTPSGTPASTKTHTAPPTQTPLQTATALSASPTAVDPLTFSDGCQVMSSGTPAWGMLLPVFTLLAAGPKRRRLRLFKGQRGRNHA